MKILDMLKRFVLAEDIEDEDEEPIEAEKTPLPPLEDEPMPQYDDFKLPKMPEEEKKEESGAALSYRKRKYIEAKTKENLAAVLKCLAQVKVIVPVKKGESMRADVMTDSAGKRYLPVFSQYSEITEDYKSNFTLIEAPFVRYVELAHQMEDMSGLVLDAFTESMVLNFEIADAVVGLAKE